MPRREKPKPTCHPNREIYAHELCAVCYFDQRRAAGEEAITALEKKLRNELVELHRATEHVVNLGRQAKAIVRENLPRYAELHLTAAEVAASKGDSKPAFEMLSGMKMPGDVGHIVDPPKKDTAPQGVQVFIGVKMGGIPEAAQIAATAQVTDGEEIE